MGNNNTPRFSTDTQLRSRENAKRGNKYVLEKVHCLKCDGKFITRSVIDSVGNPRRLNRLCKTCKMELAFKCGVFC